MPYNLKHLSPTAEYPRANLHHSVWGSSEISAHGEALLEYLASTGIDIINRRKEPTFINQVRKKVLGITLATQGLSDGISRWRVMGTSRPPTRA